MVMSELVDHQRYGSVVTEENCVTGKHSNIPKNTNRGWEVLIELRNETTSWVDIKNVKGARPIDMAEYVVANQIADDPAFDW